MKILVFLGLLFSGCVALSCTCESWQNAQQAAQSSGVIVAKVKTLKSNGDGSANLEIQKVFKGNLKTKRVKVLGQDGVNCNGEMIHSSKKPWVVLFSKYEGQYETVSCADTALRINSSNKKIEFSFQEENEVTELTESEFSKLLRFQLRPTIKGLHCFIDLRRTYITPGTFDPNPHELNFEYLESHFSDGFGPMKVQIDFSNRGPKLSFLKLEVKMRPISKFRYNVQTSMTEPFFSKLLTGQSTVDIRKSYNIETVSDHTYTNVNLDPSVPNNPNEPFVGHTSMADCSLQAGLPIVGL